MGKDFLRYTKPIRLKLCSCTSFNSLFPGQAMNFLNSLFFPFSFLNFPPFGSRLEFQWHQPICCPRIRVAWPSPTTPAQPITTTMQLSFTSLSGIQTLTTDFSRYRKPIRLKFCSCTSFNFLLGGTTVKFLNSHFFTFSFSNFPPFGSRHERQWHHAKCHP